LKQAVIHTKTRSQRVQQNTSVTPPLLRRAINSQGTIKNHGDSYQRLMLFGKFIDGHACWRFLYIWIWNYKQFGQMLQ
jgi:hypothetical protein